MVMRRLVSFIVGSSIVLSTLAAEEIPQSQEELVKNFAEIHQNLMAKVAVADMYYGCQLAKQDTRQDIESLETLILKTDRNTLGQQLIQCLGDDGIGSDSALNYGITGCFSDQTKHLNQEQQLKKMAQVEQAINTLGKEERQKSFTQCVNNQALLYLQIEN
ncbi:hypothetical protein [Thalassotalea litorea]|uniref:hypothetical protein n=1 Tax=Thalassotalea litorea TaxID=2020715 RepID=UPI00373703D2